MSNLFEQTEKYKGKENSRLFQDGTAKCSTARGTGECAMDPVG